MFNGGRRLLRAFVRSIRRDNHVSRSARYERFLRARNLTTKSNNYVCGDKQGGQHPAKSRCTGSTADGGFFPHRARITKLPDARLLRFSSGALRRGMPDRQKGQLGHGEKSALAPRGAGLPALIAMVPSGANESRLVGGNELGTEAAPPTVHETHSEDRETASPHLRSGEGLIDPSIDRLASPSTRRPRISLRSIRATE